MFFQHAEDIKVYEEALTEAEIEDRCLHDSLEDSLPPNQRNGVHMLACNCPKCSPRC